MIELTGYLYPFLLFAPWRLGVRFSLPSRLYPFLPFAPWRLGVRFSLPSRPA
jgi:hypothetical protein